MTKPMIRIHNAKTNEIIDREMTNDEYKAHLAKIELDKIRATEIEAQEAEAKVKRQAAEAKLAALGLTTEDLKALGL